MSTDATSHSAFVCIGAEGGGVIEEVFAEESLLGEADEQAEDGSGDNEWAERAAQGEFDGGGGEGDDCGDRERAEGDAVALREGAGAVPAQGGETAAEQQCHECCGDQHEADAGVLHLRVAVFHSEYGAHEGEADGGDAGVYGCHRG